MQTIPENTARAIARAIHKDRFDRHSYDAKACAQRNLSGRTHYAEDDTLRFFHARILSCRVECNGAALVLVESVAADMRNTSRGFRFVVFDLFGMVINDRLTLSPETLFKTSDKARAAADAWLSAFDIAAHYREAIADESARLRRRADALDAAALELVTQEATA